MKAARISVAVIVALAVARSAAVFDRLPLRMASHFNAAGHADGSMPRDQFFMIFAIVSLGAVAMPLGLASLCRVLPMGVLNVPHREYWLTPERIGLVQAKVAAFGSWFAVSTSALLYAVLESVLEANLRRGALDVLVIPVSLTCFALFGAGLLVWFVRAFRLPDAG